MNLQAPQIIFLALMLLGGGLHLAKNGEPREDNYSFGIWFLSSSITIALLLWGGFFNK